MRERNKKVAIALMCLNEANKSENSGCGLFFHLNSRYSQQVIDCVHKTASTTFLLRSLHAKAEQEEEGVRGWEDCCVSLVMILYVFYNYG